MVRLPTLQNAVLNGIPDKSYVKVMSESLFTVQAFPSKLDSFHQNQNAHAYNSSAC